MMTGMETATHRLHRLTSYEPGRDWDAPADDPGVLQGLQVNDFGRLPWFVKRYPGDLPRLPLPRELPRTAAAAVAVLAGTAEVSRVAPDLAQLARLLYLSAGVMRVTERPYGVHPFRAAGSAGGRFPLEVYVAVPPGGPLPAGVHWYDPWEHALVRVGPPPRAGSPAVIVTGVPWRTGWRYRERGYRHVYWDAGTMLAQLLALADSAGLTAALYTRFPDARVAALVGADRVHELPVAVVGLGDADPAVEPRRPGGGRGGGRRAGRVPAGDRGPAGRGMRPARLAVGTGRSGFGADPGLGAGRAGYRRARVAAADGRPPRPAPGTAAHRDGRGRARPGPAPLDRGCTTWRACRPGCTAGRPWTPRCARACCATSCTGCAWTRPWPATPPSSPSPRPGWPSSATRNTGRPSWPPGWPKAGCTWPPTPSAPALRG